MGTTGPTGTYESSLRLALSPSFMAITDVTDGHAVDGVLDGRALRADGKEILLLICAEAFEGMSLLDRQRQVNSILGDDLRSGRLHSVRMKCMTPAQWERHGRPQAFPGNKPCASPVSSPVSVMIRDTSPNDTSP